MIDKHDSAVLRLRVPASLRRYTDQVYPDWGYQDGGTQADGTKARGTKTKGTLEQE